MKIAIVTSFPRDVAAPRGGVEAVSVHLVRGLAALPNTSVDVVTTDAESRSVEISEALGTRIHRLPRRGRKILSDATGPGRREVQAYLRQLAPDVIHAHDVYGLMVRGLDIPRVFTIHGFIYADTLLSGTRFARPRGWLWYWHETRGWAEQPHIVSISPYVRERLKGIARGVIHDIENPIGAEFFRVERAERTGTVFCAALICPRKNQHVLVETAALLRDAGVAAEIRLAGAISDPAYGERLKARIRELRVEDRVKLLGSLTLDRVREELAAASIFALVSLEEGAPMGIEEAMAVGVPVVASNRCGMPYMVRDGGTGFLVDPTDPSDVARRIERVLKDAELRAAMGVRARREAAERFHPDVIAARTREVYERALHDHKQHHRDGRAAHAG